MDGPLRSPGLQNQEQLLVGGVPIETRDGSFVLELEEPSAVLSLYWL